MIVKIFSRHFPNYGDLIDYVVKENEKAEVVTHNVKGNRSTWTNQFKQNERFRKVERKNSVHLTHEIISFSNKDRDKVSKEMIADITRKYIELRGKEGMFVASAHYDKAHIHIHACVSGTKLYTGEAFRLSRTDLNQLKLSLEKYVKEKYPEIKHSFCQHGMGKPYMNDRKYRAQQRNEDRAYINEHLQNCFNKARSQQELLAMLMREHDIFHYERKGHVEGLVYNETKFRLSRLGVAEQFQVLPHHLNTMEKKENKELEALRQLRTEERLKENQMYKEIIYEKGGGTETIKYNDVMKETVWRDAEGKETVTFERIDDAERERLDSFADAQEYYADLNDRMEQEPETPDEKDEESRVLDELSDMRENDEDRDMDEMDQDEEIDR